MTFDLLLLAFVSLLLSLFVIQSEHMSKAIEQIQQAIADADAEKQRQLLAAMPRLLNIDAGSVSLLKAAEPGFDFWDNDEDAVYDNL